MLCIWRYINELHLNLQSEFCKKIAEVSAEEIQGFIDGSTQLIDEEEMPFIPARTNKDMKVYLLKQYINCFIIIVTAM